MDDEHEIAREIVRPHWDAVRDLFAAFVPPGETQPLSRVMEVRFEIDPKRHDTPRHFAACRTDGLLMLFAPQIVDLPVEHLIPILVHEFGHAADHLYPAYWRTNGDGPCLAQWIGDPSKTKWGRHWAKQWEDRSQDAVEWAADGIGEAVTGKHITYGGPLMLQQFCCGIERPRGLR